MGHYTSFRLNASLPRINASLPISISGVDIIGDDHPFWQEPLVYYNCTLAQLEDMDSAKWYDHQIDMAKISAKYPELLITLHGEGEDPGDVWREYYMNGMMQRADAKMTFDEFDYNKLKSV